MWLKLFTQFYFSCANRRGPCCCGRPRCWADREGRRAEGGGEGGGGRGREGGKRGREGGVRSPQQGQHLMEWSIVNELISDFYELLGSLKTASSHGLNFHHLKKHDDQSWPWHQSCLPWHQPQDHQIPTKQQKPQFLLLWFFSTIPQVRKGLMGGRFCKYQTQLLIWTCLSKNNNNKSSKHWKAYYTASHFYQELTQIPAIFYFFYDTKRGELKYRPNISTHTVQTLSKNWHFLAIYSDCLHCS